MAPRPSVFWQCSSIQRWAALIAGLRHEEGTQRSAHLSIRSTPKKKLDQEKNPSDRRDLVPCPARNNSLIPRSGCITRTGLKCDMIESGTTMVRVHADIALKLKFSRGG